MCILRTYFCTGIYLIFSNKIIILFWWLLESPNKCHFHFIKCIQFLFIYPNSARVGGLSSTQHSRTHIRAYDCITLLIFRKNFDISYTPYFSYHPFYICHLFPLLCLSFFLLCRIPTNHIY